MVQIFKVASHQEDPTNDEFLHWVFAGNRFADVCALVALTQLPPQLLAQQAELADSLSNNRRRQQELHSFFTKVGLFAVQTSASHPPPPVEEALGREPITESMVISFLQVAEQSSTAPPQMKFEGFHKVVSWLMHVHATDPSVPPTWVTWYELMWSFQRYTGIRDLKKLDCHSKWSQGPIALEYDCVKAGRSFAAFMTHLIRIAYPEFQTVVTKPSNYRWQMWGCCLPMRWNPHDKTAVMDWMSSEFGSRQLCKVNKDLGPSTPATLGPINVQTRKSVGLHRWFG